MNKFNKIDIAESQLEMALDIYFSGGNFIASLTLAGAAEEILGVCLKLKKIPNSLDETIGTTRLTYEKLYEQQISTNEIIERANRSRNNFKHLNSEEDLEIVLELEDEVHDMLERAIINYWRLKENLTQKMIRFGKKRRNA